MASMTMEPEVTAARVAPMEEASLMEEMHALKRRAAAPASVVVALAVAARVAVAAEPEVGVADINAIDCFTQRPTANGTDRN